MADCVSINPSQQGYWWYQSILVAWRGRLITTPSVPAFLTGVSCKWDILNSAESPSFYAAVVPLWRNKSFVAWRGRLLAPCIWHLSCPLQADVGKLLIWLRNIWNFAILKGNKNIVGSPMFKEKNCYHIQKGQFYSCKMPVIPIFDYDYDTPFQISQKWYVPKFVMFFFRFFISQFCM